MDAIAGEPLVGVAAPTLVEVGIVLEARAGKGRARELERFVREAGLAVVAFDAVHWRAAVDAWARFGKGRHPAGLNFGDCLAYAAARVAGRPLLCKGDDFPKTDLPLARTMPS